MISLFAPSERRRCSDWLDQILAQPAIGEMTLIGQDATVHARMLVLPLRSDMGQIDRILGCLESTSNASAYPGFYKIGDLATTAIPRPPRAYLTRDTCATATDGFANAGVGYTTQGPRARPSYLRLVKSDV